MRLFILLLFPCCLSAQSFFLQSDQTMIDFQNTVFVVFDIGQSNSIGRATAPRTIQISGEPEEPAGVLIYYKPDYTATDNGNFEQLSEGSENTSEPGLAVLGFNGAYGMLASRIKRSSPNNVYVIAAGDGGTALKENLTSPDWYEGSSGECFEIATQRYYIVAYNKIVTANPGKTIKTIICWHQGESDAMDSDGTSGYAARFTSFVTALRASHTSLANSLLIITKLYFNIDANEATINAAFQAYADANSSTVKIVDISGIHRKVDLTVAERGGLPSTGLDDQHTSYLGQRSKAIQSYEYVKAFYFPNN